MHDKNVPPTTIAEQVAALSGMAWRELKAKWQGYFGDPPGVNNRRYVIRRIAHRLQEDAVRASGDPIVERNEQRIKQLLETGKVGRRKGEVAVSVGAVLSREYGGRVHRVTVLADGAFEYAGQRYGSLSKIAREITGTRWSGPAFFGLRDSSKNRLKK